MADSVKNLKIVVGADTAQAQAGLSKLNDAFEQLTGVSLSGAGALAALAGGLKYSFDRAIEAERAMAATEAVIKSTGGAAGLTAEQVANLAASESRLTSIDDDVIQSGQNMLLTFTNIGGSVFPEATRAMENMAVAMANGDTSAIDLKGTAIQLGKALNDPIKGVSALAEVGVTFTQAQKDAIKAMVEMGDTAGAQRAILAELEKEFGGMAETMGNTSAGKMQKAQNALDNLAAAMGKTFLPTIGEAAAAAELLMTWQDRLTAGYQEQQAAVAATSRTYADYVAGSIRTELATQGVNRTLEEEKLVLQKLGADLSEVAVTHGLMAEAEWDATNAVKAEAAAHAYLGTAMQIPADATREMTRAEREAADVESTRAAMQPIITRMIVDARIAEVKSAQDAADAQQQLTDATLAYETALGGRLAGEQDSFNQKQSDAKQALQDTQTEIDKLTAKTYLTDAQKQQLDDLKKKLEDQNTALQTNADEHEKATKRILLDYVKQALAAEGVTGPQALQALMALSTQWGLTSKADQDAVNNMLAAARLLKEGSDLQTFTNTVNGAKKAVEDFGAAVNNLPTSKDIRITTHYTKVGGEDFGGAGEGKSSTYGESYVDQATGANVNTTNVDSADYYTDNAYSGPIDTGPGGGEALGDAVSAGQRVLVGDRPDKQPEIFIPSVSGRVMPQANSGGTAVHHHYYLTINTQQAPNIPAAFGQLRAQAGAFS